MTLLTVGLLAVIVLPFFGFGFVWFLSRQFRNWLAEDFTRTDDPVNVPRYGRS